MSSRGTHWLQVLCGWVIVLWIVGTTIALSLTGIAWVTHETLNWVPLKQFLLITSPFAVGALWIGLIDLAD